MSKPNIYYVTVTKVALGGAKGDVPFRITIPARWIMVASCDAGHVGDSLFLHFDQLGLTYTGNAITPVGNERWLPLFAVSSNRSKIGMGYLFDRPLPVNQDIYLDIGQEAGGGNYFITFAYSDEVCDTKLVFQG
jgi:hypothetical protein